MHVFSLCGCLRGSHCCLCCTAVPAVAAAAVSHNMMWSTHRCCPARLPKQTTSRSSWAALERALGSHVTSPQQKPQTGCCVSSCLRTPPSVSFYSYTSHDAIRAAEKRMGGWARLVILSRAAFPNLVFRWVHKTCMYSYTSTYRICYTHWNHRRWHINSQNTRFLQSPPHLYGIYNPKHF